MEKEIQVGDVVRLKSDTSSISNWMTVGEKSNNSNAKCYWIVNNELRSADIPISALVKKD
jgi:uncharacterized protein YodC (DUF2158 family)